MIVEMETQVMLATKRPKAGKMLIKMMTKMMILGGFIFCLNKG